MTLTTESKNLSYKEKLSFRREIGKLKSPLLKRMTWVFFVVLFVIVLGFWISLVLQLSSHFPGISGKDAMAVAFYIGVPLYLAPFYLLVLLFAFDVMTGVGSDCALSFFPFNSEARQYYAMSIKKYDLLTAEKLSKFGSVGTIIIVLIAGIYLFKVNPAKPTLLVVNAIRFILYPGMFFIFWRIIKPEIPLRKNLTPTARYQLNMLNLGDIILTIGAGLIAFYICLIIVHSFVLYSPFCVNRLQEIVLRNPSLRELLASFSSFYQKENIMELTAPFFKIAPIIFIECFTVAVFVGILVPLMFEIKFKGIAILLVSTLIFDIFLGQLVGGVWPEIFNLGYITVFDVIYKSRDMAIIIKLKRGLFSALPCGIGAGFEYGFGRAGLGTFSPLLIFSVVVINTILDGVLGSSD